MVVENWENLEKYLTIELSKNGGFTQWTFLVNGKILVTADHFKFLPHFLGQKSKINRRCTLVINDNQVRKKSVTFLNSLSTSYLGSSYKQNQSCPSSACRGLYKILVLAGSCQHCILDVYDLHCLLEA